MSDLQALHRETVKLQKSFKELEATVQQLESQRLSFGSDSSSISSSINTSQWNSNSQSHVSNVQYLKDSFLQIKQAAIMDEKTIATQEIVLDQEKQLRQSIKKQLVEIKGRIEKYIEHNRNSEKKENNDEGVEQQLRYFRQNCREQLLVLKNEINAMKLQENKDAAVKGNGINGSNGSNGINVRVTYWNGRGLAEPTRLLLSAGNIKFRDRFMIKPSDLEDVRRENNLLYNQLPLVEIDNMELVQSGAQIRYIARRCGMYGDSDSERYIIDLIYEGTKDARSPFGQYWTGDATAEETKEAVCLFLYAYVCLLICARI